MKQELPDMPRWDDVLKEELDGKFQIGQVYDKEPASTLICKKCGTDKFNVGFGTYFTAIRCPNCKYQYCVHNG